MTEMMEVKDVNIHNYDLWRNLTFKTNSYRKNFDLILKDEQFITEHSGEISKVRIKDRKPPFLVGEFSMSVWNFKLAGMFDVDLGDVIKRYHIEDSYKELNDAINDDIIDTTKINKLIIIQNLILHPDYRKKGVTEEFVEFIFRDHYNSKKDKVIALVKPIQNNPVDIDYYNNIRHIHVNQFVGSDSPYELIPGHKYFGIGGLMSKSDTERNEYRLYALAVRCGFKRIGETHLFEFSPEATIDRIYQKRMNQYG